MGIALGVLFVLHGLAHVVGFAVPWRLIEVDETADRATILADRWDVGTVGIRALGILWLVTGIAFVVAGVGAWSQASWWLAFANGVALVSLLLGILGWPETRIGVILNEVILLVLLIGPDLGGLNA